MELLSGAGLIASHAMAHPHAALQASGAPMAGEPLALSGVVHGKYHGGGGTSAAFSGRGRLSQVGTTQLRGTIDLASPTSGQLTLSFGRRGELFVDVTSATPRGGSTYRITGGTRSFAADTGSGVGTVQIPGLRPRGHFTLSL
jgi:hypothetical protein